MSFVAGMVVPCILFIATQVIAKAPGLRGEVFAVGGAAGWTVPHKGMVNYTEWAAMLSSLNVGDTLLFTYPAGEHNVVQVTEENFHRCRATSPIATFNDGQTLINLPREGQYWFICGISNHCSAGQKFVIEVINLRAVRPPAPAPSAGDGTPPNGGGSTLGPAAAFAPSRPLTISPGAAAFGPSPFPFNSAPHGLHYQGGSISVFLSSALAVILAAF